ncbi:MAG TPA: hypothetical protein VET66_08760, partial [Steroidobacteraceae bacterium]|nr:hypothetical protein [Steroidobacteraceae bacterium]
MLLAGAALVLLVALVGASAFAWRAAALSRTSAGTSLAELNAESLRANPAAGCAGAPPAPQPNVVYSGTPPDHASPPPNEIALTFDDGPTPSTTIPILE